MADEKINSLSMSKPVDKIVHGVTVKKMPMGAYIKFMQNGSKLLPMILDKLFPGMSSVSIISRAMQLEREALIRSFGELLIEAPTVIMDALSDLMGVPVADLMDNPMVGPNELWDIIEAWNEINDLSGFFARVSRQSRRPSASTLTPSAATGTKV